MIITRLSAENFKRLKAVEIEPQGNIVTISGRNAQGKSSTLDAIAAAFGGRAEICDEPVRRGAKKAEVICETPDFKVIRSFTPGGNTQLRIVLPDGTEIAKPQGYLDPLVGKIAFDPFAFSRLNPAQQRDTLRGLVGLDLNKLEGERQDAYDQRTQVNRDVATKRARLDSMPFHDDAPEKVMELQELITQRQDAAKIILQSNDLRDQMKVAERNYIRAQQEVDRIQKVLDEVKASAASQLVGFNAAKAACAGIRDPNLAAIEDKISGIEQSNKKVRDNAAYVLLESALRSAEEKSADLTAEIAKIDQEKADAISSAKFPIPHLGFDDRGVIFHDLPLAQGSSREQLTVSLAIGMAMSPELRVILIRDGSLIDQEGMELIEQMAGQDKDRPYQIWIEKVCEVGEATGIVIEDGLVADAELKDG
jgi:hypothetical protein